MRTRQTKSQIPSLLAGALLALGAACRAAPAPEAAPTAGSPGASAGSPAAAAPAPATPAQSRVLPGLEVLLRDSAHLVRGKRVGLITNQSAVTTAGEHAADLLKRTPGVQLVALFGPEHGVRGDVEGGVTVGTQQDPRTGVPVYSLYDRTQRPTAEELRGIEVLLFDIQDIGARPYTFVWTMAMAMETAAQHGIPFVVLDRPNPITDTAEGGVMEMEMRTVAQAITGYYPVPLRHGMTVGEVARYLNGEYKLGVDLRVVPAAGWRPRAWFDQTGLPWINPSPNIRSLEAALSYSGLVLSEATNLTVGRGTPTPFSYLGAPWLDTPALLARLRQYQIPGVRLDSASFVPQGEGWVPFRGERVRAVRFTITDREAYRPVWMTLVLLSEIKRLHPTQLKITNEGFTQMLGSRWARQAFDRGDDPRTIQQRWDEEVRRWREVQDRYRLYR